MNNISRQGRVFANGKLAGLLTEYQATTGVQKYAFEYDGDYIIQGGTPVGYHFPLKSEPYLYDMLHPFFTNLVSEGWVRVFQASKARLDKRDDFGLLLANGDDLISAISVQPSNKDMLQ
jgi:serine/threonine-protein kinase HipA